MWYDAIIVAVLLFCTIRGAAKGFAWQVAAIGALILCFVFAESGSLALAPLIQLDPPANRWVAMFVLYLGASFVSFAAARMVRTTLEKWQFVEYDKHLGAIFGFVKGAAIGLVITFFAVTLSERTRAQVLASYSGYTAGHVMSALHPVMPAELHAVIDPYIEKLGGTVVHHDDFGHDHDGSDPHGDDFGNLPPLSVNPSNPSDRPAGQAGEPIDGFGPAPPDFGTPPDWSDRPQQAPAASDELRRIVESIPAELKESALTALKNTQPEDREELLAAFRTAIPGLIRAVSMEWQEGKPAVADRRTRRDETLREIAAVYNARDLNAQRTIIRQAEEQLRGVPDEVADVVVQDWYADLLRLDAEDPDPRTNLSTRLDERIRRQLSAFGIAPEAWSADLRARLGATPR